MELILADEDQGGGEIVQGYDSLIWTERWGKTGDFLLTTGRVDEFFTMLPFDRVLFLRDSTVPMIIEEKKIIRKRGQPSMLEVRGRSYESILDRRVFRGEGGASYSATMRNPSDLAWGLMWLVADGSFPLILEGFDKFPPELVAFPQPSDYGDTSLPIRDWDVKPNDLLTVVNEILAINTDLIAPRSLRAVRAAPGLRQFAIEIYDGVDRSAEVEFNIDRDSFDDGTYVFSRSGYKNVGYLKYSDGFTASGHSPDGGSYTGMNRREALFTTTDSFDSPSSDLVRNKIDMEMASKIPLALFDGAINQDLIPYVYGVDYDLGDIVSLNGEYGISNKARVTEFIRSFDNTGYRAYPTLQSIVETGVS